MKYFYKIYNMTIRSQLELAGVQSYTHIDTNNIDVDIVVERPLPLPIKGLASTERDPIAEFSEQTTNLHFREGWSLCISRAGNKLMIYADERHFAKASTLVLGTGLSILMLYRNLYPLHAGGFALDNKGIAISGDSGVGKSTFVRSIMKRGYKIMSDDCLPLQYQFDQVVVQPSLTLKSKVRKEVIDYFSIPLSQLSNESLYNGKKWVSIDEKDRIMQPLQLKSIYFLCPANTLEQATVEVITGQEKFKMFFKNILCFTDLPAIDVKQNLIRGEPIVDVVEMYRLRYPKGLKYLELAIDEIIENENRTMDGKE